MDDSISLSQLFKQKGCKGKRSRKTTVQPPPKSTHEQAEEFCEEINRRHTEATAKEDLTLTEWIGSNSGNKKLLRWLSLT